MPYFIRYRRSDITLHCYVCYVFSNEKRDRETDGHRESGNREGRGRGGEKERRKDCAKIEE